MGHKPHRAKLPHVWARPVWPNAALSLAYLLAVLALAVPADAKPPVTKGEDVAYLKDLSPYLIDRLHDAKGWPGPKVADLVEDSQYQALIEKHDLKLLGGPMLGQMTGGSVSVWLRTAYPASVRVDVASEDSPSSIVATARAQTAQDQDMVATLPITGLKPKTQYVYQVYVDDKAVFDERPDFTTYPSVGAPGRSTVVFSACSRYIPKNESIWRLIQKQQPDAFLTLGDNVYIDAPKRYGKQRLHYYRRQMRPEYQAVTAGSSIYAIWDDHDFGRNDSSGGLDPHKPKWKPRVWQVFKQNWNNPYYGGGQEQPGCWFDFSIGDVHFIMTDGRYYRDFDKGTMLGPAQRRWLTNTLKESDAAFTVIASSTLWTRHADKGGADSWWGVKEERNALLKFIADQNIPGVVLLSGDRHRADVYKIDWSGDYPLWEFENAVLTNKHHHGTRKQAVFSYNKGHMFGVLEFDTERADPTLTYRIVTDEDKTVYKKTLHRSTLSP
jgi:alkaline phosphatase D